MIQTCICYKTIVFMVTLVGINEKLALSQIQPFFMQEVSPKYLLRQMEIARYFSDRQQLEKA